MRGEISEKRGTPSKAAVGAHTGLPMLPYRDESVSQKRAMSLVMNLRETKGADLGKLARSVATASELD